MEIPLFEFLDTVGDGSGTKNAVGDYSNQQFKIVPPAPTIYYIRRMIVNIVDTGNMNAGTYGVLSALSNGISINYVSNGVTYDLTGEVTVKTNGDWGRYCYDVSISDLGAVTNYVTARWTFAKALGGLVEGIETPNALTLYGNNGDYFYANLNDDFAGITSHYFMVQGEQFN